MAKSFILYLFILTFQITTILINENTKLFKFIHDTIEEFWLIFLFIAILCGLLQGFSKMFSRKSPLNIIIFTLYIMFTCISLIFVEEVINAKYILLMLTVEFFSIFGLFAYFSSSPKKYEILDGFKFMILFWILSFGIYLGIY